MAYMLFIASVLFSAVLTNGAEIIPRLIGGKPIDIVELQEFSYFAMVPLTGEGACSGFMLKDTAILTAAHCFDNQESADLENVELITIYPDYNKETRENDIAIVFLQPTQNVQTINLSTKDIDTSKKCIAFGISKDMTSSDFEPQYKEVVVTKCEVESKSRICTADDQNRGILCLGDAGAPLVCDNELVGIAVSNNSCGSEVPDEYQKIKDLKEWIEKEVSKFTPIKATAPSNSQASTSPSGTLPVTTPSATVRNAPSCITLLITLLTMIAAFRVIGIK